MFANVLDSLHLGSHIGALILAAIAGHLPNPLPPIHLHIFGRGATIQVTLDPPAAGS